MATNIWVPKGLQPVTATNLLSQTMRNMAYVAELYLMVSGVDPSYSSRTSNEKKMVYLSNPPNTNPVYPVVVISFVNLSGRVVGDDPVLHNYQIQCSIFGLKSQESAMERMVGELIKGVKAERANLHDVGMYYTADAIPFSFSPFMRDGDNPQLLFASVTFNFYSIL